ncbi:MAG: DUF4032 domain-containing protein [Candidatus Dormibacteraeota bacterium]|nr:DUF4032 domain-containing protein [Candidatus Dormibacteraeota bacterium]
MSVSFERCIGIDEPKLARHAEMNNENNIVFEVDEDVLPPPSHPPDAHARDRVDEELGFGMPHDAREIQLAAHDSATFKMRPQVGDDGLDFRQLRQLLT